jgi:hypothetical protein
MIHDWCPCVDAPVEEERPDDLCVLGDPRGSLGGLGGA